MKLRFLSIVLVGFGLVACKDERAGKSRGPIVLGDSSTIVTETNPDSLRDLVPDLKPVLASEQEDTAAAPAAVTADTATAAAPATETPAAAPPAAAPAGNGLNVPFKEVSLFIPNVTTRSYGKPNLQKARGASYELTGGSLAGKQLRVSGSLVSKVSQRYESVVVLKKGNETLALESLGKFTSPWQVVNGSGGNYAISGIDAGRLQYKNVNNNAIRNAVQQAARRKRLSRAATQDWLNAARNVRSANQAPAAVALRSVMWRVEGKGFSKELRVDVPVQ